VRTLGERREDPDDLRIDPGGPPIDGIEALGLDTRHVGARLHYLTSTGSTNAVLAELARNGEPHGALVIADEQTEGRGRIGRAWFSPPRAGICASVLLITGMSPAELSPLSIACAVSVAEALNAAFGADVRVKWPNDLLVGGRKLGGLLVETTRLPVANPARTGRLAMSAVVGIGLNVNLAERDLPPELRTTATSLEIALEGRVSRLRALRVVLGALEGCFDTFLETGMGAFMERWRAVSTLLGGPVRVEAGGRRIEGTVTGISPSGALLVRLASGETEEVWHGDATLRSS
jgi:BirA family transcriptional regulator, biotin operon repressor / biotin---[acetyl-CoA-carboxylase] ligase